MVSAGRGQLILVGAIAMALIVIGLVLVINTALFTQIVGSEGTVEGTKGAGVAVQEIEDATAAAVHQQNVNRSTDPSADDLNGSSMAELNQSLLNRSLTGSGAVVDAIYVGNNVTGSHRFNASGDASLASPGGSNDWDLLTDGAVGHFYLVLDVSAPSVGDTMSVEVASETLEITKSDSDEITFDVTGGTTCTVNATSGTVRTDVYRGVVHEDASCAYDLFERTDPPYDVRFVNTDTFQGRYSLVTDASDSASICTSNTCEPAVWTFDLRVAYDTIEVSAGTPAGTSTEVPVYD